MAGPWSVGANRHMAEAQKPSLGKIRASGRRRNRQTGAGAAWNIKAQRVNALQGHQLPGCWVRNAGLVPLPISEIGALEYVFSANTVSEMAQTEVRPDHLL